MVGIIKNHLVNIAHAIVRHKYNSLLEAMYIFPPGFTKREYNIVKKPSLALQPFTKPIYCVVCVGKMVWARQRIKLRFPDFWSDVLTNTSPHIFSYRIGPFPTHNKL